MDLMWINITIRRSGHVAGCCGQRIGFRRTTRGIRIAEVRSTLLVGGYPLCVRAARKGAPPNRGGPLKGRLCGPTVSGAAQKMGDSETDALTGGSELAVADEIVRRHVRLCQPLRPAPAPPARQRRGASLVLELAVPARP